MTSSLPDTMRAIVVETTSGPTSVQTVPTPQPTHGSTVVKILSAGVISYMRDIYNGKRSYEYATPLIAGTSAVGRVAAVGPDAVKLKPGDLVFVGCIIRSRDSDDIFLAGITSGGTEGSKKLMANVWRDWTYAEYCRTTLENLFVLDEQRLIGEGGLGYTTSQLNYAAAMLVPYGGLRDIHLKAGETIIIAPATGQVGAAAVYVALTMGAKVVAFGRNASALTDLKERMPYTERLSTVAITGDMAGDNVALKKAARGSADAFLDIGPAEAEGSTHFTSAILALGHSGRVSLMGGGLNDVPMPHRFIMRFNIKLQGKWMCERSDIKDFFKRVHAGLIDLSVCQVVGEFKLEDFKEAWDAAVEKRSFRPAGRDETLRFRTYAFQALYVKNHFQVARLYR